MIPPLRVRLVKKNLSVFNCFMFIILPFLLSPELIWRLNFLLSGALGQALLHYNVHLHKPGSHQERYDLMSHQSRFLSWRGKDLLIV